MHWTITTWDGFRDAWDGVHNFLVNGEVAPFDFAMPPLERVVDELRRDEMANLGTGARNNAPLGDEEVAAFRALPIAEALRRPFTLAHFRLSRFDKPGGFLHGFQQAVLEPWQAGLRAAGFSWERCYPIIFISGAGCSSSYHMDFSHVLAWQIYGRKKFCGLKTPGRWAPWRMRMHYAPGRFARPEALGEDDFLAYDMKPGDKLWNALLTPHEVAAVGNEVALSVNISHGGLRLEGRLCPFERELEEFREQYPDAAPAKVQGHY
jgi:hypothetical protein